jgi:hypothetical protein
MATKKNIHVVPHDGHWDVVREGSTRAQSSHATQEEAWEAGRAAAQQTQGEVLLHGRDGQIRERNTYGDDPNPPKG